MNTPNPATIAVMRFGLGPCAAASMPTGNPRDWVESQIGGSALDGLDPALLPTPENVRNWALERQAKIALRKARVEEARRKQSGADAVGTAAASPATMTHDTPSMAAPHAAAMGTTAGSGGAVPRWTRPAQELDARLRRMLAREDALAERMTLFWADYFTVAGNQTPMQPLFCPFEREALRPHIFGPFRQMLIGAVTHPAMLVYLDNDSSVGPNSALGQLKKRGLNENLAREILELHTLGSDGGYTQADVTTFAAVLTGWVTNRRPDRPRIGETRFSIKQHEPGPKTLLGKTYPDLGEQQLMLVLNDLARHPSTARHVATRMCRTFIGETPPPALVARMADTFRRTDGDLAAVTRVLVRSDEAWALPARKLRPPLELIHVTARLLGAVPAPPVASGALLAMGQPYLGAPSPKGWPDEDNAWAIGDGIKTRLDWARAVAARFQGQTDVRQLMDGALGGHLSDETRTTVLQAESQEQALTLLIMSPELQRR